MRAWLVSTKEPGADPRFCLVGPDTMNLEPWAFYKVQEVPYATWWVSLAAQGISAAEAGTAFFDNKVAKKYQLTRTTPKNTAKQ